MLDFSLKIFFEFISILADTSIYLLFGFFLAGLLHVYLPPEKITRFFGKRDLRSVFNASLFGVPLPLCSCSVLPTAISLRKNGASKGSVFSFLISTPETSVPSIGISLALLDPLMTIFRPIAAFITAILAGLGVNIIDRNDINSSELSDDVTEQSPGSEPVESSSAREDAEAETTMGKVSRGLKYSFIELLNDIAPWLVIGIFAAAVISALIPQDFFAGSLGRGIWPMLLMLAVGLPLYVCAEGSTPIAAALILKGLSPGAAFVFLLAGPATNIGSLIVLSQYFSRKILTIYLAAIALMALLLGGLLNSLYSVLDLDISATLGTAAEIIPGWFKGITTVIFVALLHRSLASTGQYTRFWTWCKKATGWTGTKLVRVLAAIVIIFYIADGLFVVPAGSEGMSIQFGKVTRSELGPGLYYRLPTPFGNSVIVKTGLVQSLEIGFRRTDDERNALLYKTQPETQLVGEILDELPYKDMPEESLLLAGDENLIDLDCTVHYRIEDAYQATFKVDNIEQLLRELVTYHLLKEISTREVPDKLTRERVEFETNVAASLQRAASELNIGVEILHLNVIYAHPPDVVHSSYRDVASAMEDKYRLMNLAQADSISKIVSAHSKATRQMQTAQADSAENVCLAVGESDRFLNIARMTQKRRQDQQFRMNAEAAESTLVEIEKILMLTKTSQTLDLILIPKSENILENLPPEVLERLQTSIGTP